MDVDQAAARHAVNQSILVEPAKGKIRASNNDMPVSCRILKRHEVLRQLVRFLTDMRETSESWTSTLESWLTRQFDPPVRRWYGLSRPATRTPEVEHEIATSVPATSFNGLDDFTSKLVTYFYTNAHMHDLVMRHCIKLHIPHRDPLMPVNRSNAELLQLTRRAFDVIPGEQRYSEYTMVGVILGC
eukprot:jgi/Tetstr1/449122/TSEL_036332.t1